MSEIEDRHLGLINTIITIVVRTDEDGKIKRNLWYHFQLDYQLLHKIT